MITYYIGDEEVTAYSRDLVTRLLALGEQFPFRWFAIGDSGEKMVARLATCLPEEYLDKIKVSYVRHDRGGAKIEFDDSIKDVQFGDDPVLVVDSAIHSGKTMLSVINALYGHGVKRVLSYTLILKRCSVFIPSYFGVLIDDKDRGYFELKALPNNRLHNKPAFGILRELTSEDGALAMLPVDAPFKDITVGDLVYSKDALSFHAYVYMFDQEVAGFITFKKVGSKLFIDTVGVPTKYMDKKIGGALLRWAETWARSNSCDFIELWGYETAVPKYLKLEYTTDDANWRILGDQRYKVMKKKILYHIRPQDE